MSASAADFTAIPRSCVLPTCPLSFQSAQLLFEIRTGSKTPVTDDSLSSGKSAAGPAFRITIRRELWNVALIAGQRWSFASQLSQQYLLATEFLPE